MYRRKRGKETTEQGMENGSLDPERSAVTTPPERGGSQKNRPEKEEPIYRNIIVLPTASALR